LSESKPAAGRTSGKPALSIADIAALNLFGHAKPTGDAPPAFDAPETRLRLTLEGVFQAERPEESAAIVSEQGKPGELFLVGGKMPGNAVLTEVHADRIVLRRGTVFETLRFSDEPSMFTPNSREEPPMADASEAVEEPPAPDNTEAAEAPPDASSGENPAAIGNVVQSYRERLQQDPVGTLNSLGVAPVSSAGAQGYRLDNLANSPYLAQTGLQAGDVVLSVNGRPVGDVQQDQAEIDNIVAQGSARLEVQRGTRRFFVTASLK
jgi:general secretion pathway protein C